MHVAHVAGGRWEGGREGRVWGAAPSCSAASPCIHAASKLHPSCIQAASYHIHTASRLCPGCMHPACTLHAPPARCIPALSFLQAAAGRSCDAAVAAQLRAVGSARPFLLPSPASSSRSSRASSPTRPFPAHSTRSHGEYCAGLRPGPLLAPVLHCTPVKAAVRTAANSSCPVPGSHASHLPPVRLRVCSGRLGPCRAVC